MSSYIVTDVFKDIVTAVSTKLTPQLSAIDNNITGVWFQHGHPKEIIDTLAQLAGGINTKKERYPLIGLFQDFTEHTSADNSNIGIDFSVDLHMIIAVRTEPNYKADQRLEKSFKPILYPIYEELLKQIYYSRAIMLKGVDQIEKDKTDRVYWGNKGLVDLDPARNKNVFNDWIDCIEIRFRNLNFYPNNQCY